MRQVTFWIGLLMAGSAVIAAPPLDEVKQRWRAGDYANAVSPLIDWHYAVPPGSPVAQEIDYMLARALCVMPDYHFREGCVYSRNLLRLYPRGYLVFERKNYSTADLVRNCCPPEPEDGVVTERYASTAPPTVDEILHDIAKKFALPIRARVSAPAALVTTTLNVQRTEATLQGDWITGFRLIAIDRAVDTFFHWMVRLEVEYVYNIGHGPVVLTGIAKGGPFDSGFSYWGPLDDQAYGPQFRKAVQRLQIAIHLQQPEAAANSVSLTLQESAPPYRTIIGEDFPFAQVFRRP